MRKKSNLTQRYFTHFAEHECLAGEKIFDEGQYEIKQRPKDTIAGNWEINVLKKSAYRNIPIPVEVKLIVNHDRDITFQTGCKVCVVGDSCKHRWAAILIVEDFLLSMQGRFKNTSSSTCQLFKEDLFVKKEEDDYIELFLSKLPIEPQHINYKRNLRQVFRYNLSLLPDWSGYSSETIWRNEEEEFTVKVDFLLTTLQVSCSCNTAKEGYICNHSRDFLVWLNFPTSYVIIHDGHKNNYSFSSEQPVGLENYLSNQNYRDAIVKGFERFETNNFNYHEIDNAKIYIKYSNGISIVAPYSTTANVLSINCNCEFHSFPYPKHNLCEYQVCAALLWSHKSRYLKLRSKAKKILIDLKPAPKWSTFDFNDLNLDLRTRLDFCIVVPVSKREFKYSSSRKEFVFSLDIVFDGMQEIRISAIDPTLKVSCSCQTYGDNTICIHSYFIIERYFRKIYNDILLDEIKSFHNFIERKLESFGLTFDDLSGEEVWMFEGDELLLKNKENLIAKNQFINDIQDIIQLKRGNSPVLIEENDKERKLQKKHKQLILGIFNTTTNSYTIFLPLHPKSFERMKTLEEAVKAGFSPGTAETLLDGYNYIYDSPSDFLDQFYNSFWDHLTRSSVIIKSLSSGSEYKLSIDRVKLLFNFKRVGDFILSSNEFFTTAGPIIVDDNKFIFSDTKNKTIHLLENSDRFLFPNGNPLYFPEDDDSKDFDDTELSFKIHYLQRRLLVESIIIPLLHFGRNLRVEENTGIKILTTESSKWLHKVLIRLNRGTNALEFVPSIEYDHVEFNVHEYLTYGYGIYNRMVLVLPRDRELEDAFIKIIGDLHVKMKRVVKNHFVTFFISKKNAFQDDWLSNTVDHLKNLGYDVTVDASVGYSPIIYDAFTWSVSENISTEADSAAGWFDVEIIVLDSKGRKINFEDIVDAVSQDNLFVILSDGSRARIPDDLIIQIKNFLSLSASSDGSGRFRFNEFNTDNLLGVGLSQKFIETITYKYSQLKSIIETIEEVPSNDFNAKLRSYQITGFRHLIAFQRVGWGFLLNDDMGLGKTIQTLAFIDYMQSVRVNPLGNEYNFNTSLVICSKGQIETWYQETVKFAPKIKVIKHYKVNRDDLSLENLSNVDLVITTYGIFTNDIDIFKQFNWKVLVLDEAHIIRNTENQLFKSITSVNVNHRIGLTGTSVQNSSKDLFGLHHFLNPGMLGSKKHFVSNYTKHIDRKFNQDVILKLRSKIHVFSLRRTKEQVATDLPSKIIQEVPSLLEPEHLVHINILMEAGKRIIRESQSQITSRVNQLNILVQQILMGILCPNIINPKFLKEKIYIDPYKCFKVSFLMDQVSQIIETDSTTSDSEGVQLNKVLVFSRFVKFLDVVASEFESRNIRYYRIDGSVEQKDRQFQMDKFNDPNDLIQVFLISIGAGGTGLNLQAANYVFIMDPHWNPAIEDQAMDRAHRIGQKRTVQVIKPIAKDTIEEKVRAIQKRKRKIQKSLEAGIILESLDSGNSGSQFNEEELLEIFSSED